MTDRAAKTTEQEDLAESAAGDAAAGAGKKARGEELAAWQKPDYSGPLTGDQALWRTERMSTK